MKYLISEVEECTFLYSELSSVILDRMSGSRIINELAKDESIQSSINVRLGKIKNTAHNRKVVIEEIMPNPTSDSRIKPNEVLLGIFICTGVPKYMKFSGINVLTDNQPDCIWVP